MERASRAECFGGFGELDGLGGGVRASARDDLAAAIGEFHGEADHLEVLLSVEGGGFSGGADGDDSVDSGSDLPLNESLERGDIDFAVAKRGDESGVGAGKMHDGRTMDKTGRRSKLYPAESGKFQIPVFDLSGKSTASPWWTLLFRFGSHVAHVAGAALRFGFLHLCLAGGHALDPRLFLNASAGLEFGLGNLAHEPSLADGEDVLSGPVESES